MRFKAVSLKCFEPNAKGGFVLTHDANQGFLWRIEGDRKSFSANPIIYKLKRDACLHRHREGTYEIVGKSREQVTQNFITQSSGEKD
jgi:hypothetical protein